MTPVSTERGGQRENLTVFLESLFMAFYKMVLHFKAVNAIFKKIIGGFYEFSLWLQGGRKRVINRSFLVRLLPKSNQLQFFIWEMNFPKYSPLLWTLLAEPRWRGGVLWKLVFDHVTLIKVRGQVWPCGKIFPRLRYMWAKNEKKRSNNKGDIQGHP